MSKRIPFTITKCSALTGKTSERTINLTQEEYDLVTDSKRTTLMQVLLPSHSNDDREFLISGITPGEWKEFEDDDDIALEQDRY
jgi:hypothetical protein